MSTKLKHLLKTGRSIKHINEQIGNLFLFVNFTIKMLGEPAFPRSAFNVSDIT